MKDWDSLIEKDLNVSTKVILEQKDCEEMFNRLEEEIVYFTGALAEVKVFGKVHPIPRQQSAYGDEGVKYKYSGLSITAQPWTKTLRNLN